MSKRSIAALVETVKALINASDCGALLVISDGKSGLCDVEICSNLSAESQRTIAHHILDHLDGRRAARKERLG